MSEGSMIGTTWEFKYCWWRMTRRKRLLTLDEWHHENVKLGKGRGGLHKTT